MLFHRSEIFQLDIIKLLNKCRCRAVKIHVDVLTVGSILLCENQIYAFSEFRSWSPAKVDLFIQNVKFREC
jgi:hypothetical protein